MNLGDFRQVILVYINNVSLILSLCVLQAWPEDALEMVANRFLDEVEMSREVRGECVSLCKHFHQRVRGLSER